MKKGPGMKREIERDIKTGKRKKKKINCKWKENILREQGVGSWVLVRKHATCIRMKTPTGCTGSVTRSRLNEVH
jgi:hypothetical protein